MSKLFVYTLNYNGKEKLEKLRCGLFKNFAYLSMRAGKPIIPIENYPCWFVRDNGSKDDSVEYLMSCQFKSDLPFHTMVYEMGHNRENFAQGMNYLFHKTQPKDDDLILLLNNDVQFNDSKSLHNMIELQKESQCDVVGARLLYTDTQLLQHSGVIFSNRYGTMPYHYRPNEKSDKDAEKDRYFQAVTAAVMLVTARAFRAIKGLDEGYSWAFEDIAACLSIGQLKPNNIVYCGRTNIYHDESATLHKLKTNQLFLQSNVKRFKDQWAGKYEIDHDKYLNDKDYNLYESSKV